MEGEVTRPETCNGHGEDSSSMVVACPECQVELSESTTLREHMQPGFYLRKDLCCRRCLGVFASECSFQAHCRMHENKAPYVCPECGLQLLDGKGRDRHMLIHRDERWTTKAWMCPVCCKQFNSTTQLLSHLIAFHTELLFSCEPCNRLLYSVSAFERHCQQKHGKEAEHQPNLYYACGISACSWKTKSREELKLHFNEHLTVPSELPRCFCCGRIYQTEADLANHQTTYHTEEAISKLGYKSTLDLASYSVESGKNAIGKSESLVYATPKRDIKKKRFDSFRTTDTERSTRNKMYDHSHMSHSCRCCGMLAPEKRILLEHGQDHIKAGTLVCLLCINMPMESDLALRQHLRLHSRSDLGEIMSTLPRSDLSAAEYFSALRVLHLQA